MFFQKKKNCTTRKATLLLIFIYFLGIFNHNWDSRQHWCSFAQQNLNNIKWNNTNNKKVIINVFLSSPENIIFYKMNKKVYFFLTWKENVGYFLRTRMLWFVGFRTKFYIWKECGNYLDGFNLVLSVEKYLFMTMNFGNISMRKVKQFDIWKKIKK